MRKFSQKLHFLTLVFRPLVIEISDGVTINAVEFRTLLGIILYFVRRIWAAPFEEVLTETVNQQHYYLPSVDFI